MVRKKNHVEYIRQRLAHELQMQTSKKKSIFIAAARTVKKNAEKNRRFIFEIHMRKRKNHQFQYHNMYPPHDLMTVLKKK